MKNDQKIKSSKMLATLLLCSGLVGAGSAFSQELTADGKVRCTIATAENMSSVRDLCNCQVVTPGMLGYLRRQDDFGEILEITNEYCPALAALLIDVSVAATPVPSVAEDNDGRKFPSGPSSDDDDDDDDDGGNGNGNGGDNGNGNGDDGDDNKGHGNDPDGCDEDNPGKSTGTPPASCGLEGDHDRGHGNDADGVDEDNPGKSKSN